MTAIVGQNDSGKSGILHALRIFFDPPKKGGVPITDLHGKDESKNATIEIAFVPQSLQSLEVQIDAKNKSHIVDDHIVDSQGLLRARISVSTRRIEGFELLISDVDDDELFPLGLKNHDELYNLLAARGLPAKKAGKETNQEKRNVLRADAVAKGRGQREQWVDATSIEKLLREIFPKFIFFTDTARYGMGETSVQNQFRGVVDRALASHPTAQQIEADIKTTIQVEFDKVYQRLSRLTDTVTGMQAAPKVSWKKAIDGIDLTWSDNAGIELPFELRGAGVRRLFMVAYFQYEAAESLHDPSGPRYIFTIEEPEIHLHPGAQRLLDTALRELGELGHSVLFTTHSPVFAASTPIDNLMLVTRTAMAAKAIQAPALDTRQIAADLGVEASDRLVGKSYVVLVEGSTDAEFYMVALTELFNAKHTSLSPDDILFLQCGGINNLKFVATTQCMDEAGLNWAVIADSDRNSASASIGKNTQALINACPKTCKHLKVLDRTSIENYFDPAVVKKITGIDCLIHHYGRATSMSRTPLSNTDWEKIKKAGPQIAQAMGASGLIAMSTNSASASEWVTLFNDLKTYFGL